MNLKIVQIYIFKYFDDVEMDQFFHKRTHCF